MCTKITTTLFLGAITLVACKEESKKKPNKSEIITKLDSMIIYNKMREIELDKSEKKKEVIKFLDSLEENDIDKYDILHDELLNRGLNSLIK